MNSVKKSNTFTIKIGDNYEIETKLYTSGDILINACNSITKHLFSTSETPKGILKISELAGITLQSDNFYKLLESALEPGHNNFKTIGEIDGANSLILNIKWDLEKDGISEPKSFVIILKRIEQTDADRMEKMLRDFVAREDAITKSQDERIKHLESELEEYIGEPAKKRYKTDDDKVAAELCNVRDRLKIIEQRLANLTSQYYGKSLSMQ